MRQSWRPRLLLALGWLLFGCGTDGPNPNGGDLTHNQVLEKLGVKTALPGLTGVDGKPLAADYNPLSRKRRALQPLAEIYMAGVPSPAGGRQVLRDDGTEAYSVIDLGVRDDDWARLPKVSTAGDFDGDGRQEVALLVLDNDASSPSYRKLSLRIIEDQAESFAVTEKVLTTLSDLSELEGTLGGYYLKLDIAAGDLDGDGRDEIFATCLGELWVIDDREAQESHGIMLSRKFPVSGGASQFLRVAGGDTDGDGRAELVVVDGQMDPLTKTGTVQYHLYDGLTETRSGQVKLDSISCELMTADVAIGDVDGDRLGEIVFSGRQSGAPTTHRVLVMDDAQAGYGFLTVDYSYTPIYSQEPNFVPLHRVETGDFDGDNVAEIVSFDQILDDLQSQTHLVKVGTLPYDVAWSTILAVGDVTNDHKDDIVFLRGTNLDALVVVYGTDPNGTYTQHHTLDVPDQLTYPTLTTVNTDNDSALVEFQSHELRFSSPRILAVMAAPPWYKEIPTDNVLAGTSFGKATTTGADAELSLGFKVGYSVTVGGRYLVAGGSLTTSVEASFDVVATRSSRLKRAVSYTGTADSDKVVFAAVPLDLYHYKILTSPRADEVGQTMIISIPRQPEMLFVDRAFFNDNNGGFPDLDSTVLGHTIGDPRSYPRATQIDRAGLEKSGGFYSGKMTVGQGMGFQTAEISTSSSTSVKVAFDLAVEFQAKAGIDFDIGVAAGSLQAGPTGGFHLGFAYTISAEKTTTFAGSVGNIIGGDDWASRRFDFGLYVQPTSYQSQKFPVIGYWVD